MWKEYKNEIMEVSPSGKARGSGPRYEGSTPSTSILDPSSNGRTSDFGSGNQGSNPCGSVPMEGWLVGETAC